MKKGSIARTFQLLNRNPAVLLLFLPLTVVQAALAKLAPAGPSAETAVASFVSFAVSALSALLSLASLFFLMPAAVELLRGGAAGRAVPPGWFARGVKNHWWKPAAASFLGGGVAAVLLVIYCVPMVIALTVFLAATVPDVALTSASSQFFAGIGVTAGACALALLLAAAVVSAFFSLLLPALADRGFGPACALLFREGLGKFAKLLLATAVCVLGGGLVMGALFFVWAELNGGFPGSLEQLANASGAFLSSWTYCCAMPLVSLFEIFLFTYRFVVYQELKEMEPA